VEQVSYLEAAEKSRKFDMDNNIFACAGNIVILQASKWLNVVLIVTFLFFSFFRH
jgi:hypothetical protein